MHTVTDILYLKQRSIYPIHAHYFRRRFSVAASRVWNSLSGTGISELITNLCALLKTIKRRSYIAWTLPSQCHASPQITMFHLNMAKYKFHYLLTYLF